MDNKKIYIIGGIIAALGIGVGAYFIFRKPKSKKDSLNQELSGVTDTNSESSSPETTTSKDCKEGKWDITATAWAADKSGWTGKANGKIQGKDFKVGDKIIGKSGSQVQRIDANGCVVGATTLPKDTELGTGYNFNANSVWVKARKGMKFPFYQISNSDVKV